MDRYVGRCWGCCRSSRHWDRPGALCPRRGGGQGEQNSPPTGENPWPIAPQEVGGTRGSKLETVFAGSGRKHPDPGVTRRRWAGVPHVLGRYYRIEPASSDEQARMAKVPEEEERRGGTAPPS